MPDCEHLLNPSEGRPKFSLQGNFILMWENFVISIFRTMNQCPVLSTISVDVGPYCYQRGKLESGDLRTVGRNMFSRV